MFWWVGTDDFERSASSSRREWSDDYNNQVQDTKMFTLKFSEVCGFPPPFFFFFRVSSYHYFTIFQITWFASVCRAMFGKTRGLHHCSVRLQRHHHFRRQSWARFYFDSRALVSYGLLDVICLDHESFYQVSLDNLTHAQNEVYSSKFSEWLKSELNLESNRGYIVFQDPGRSHIGWDSLTIYCRYSAPWTQMNSLHRYQGTTFESILNK